MGKSKAISRRTTAHYRDMIPDDKKDIEFNSKVFRKFGCVECDWRGTGRCPYKLPRGKGRGREFVLPGGLGDQFDGMCDMRKFYLISIYSGKSNVPTLKQIQIDYNRAIVNDTLLETYQSWLLLRDKIIGMETELKESGPDVVTEDDIKELKKEELFLLTQIRESQGSLDKGYHRDEELKTKQKLVDHQVLGVADINRIIIDVPPEDDSE